MDRRTTRLLVWVGLAPPLLIDALYLGLIRGQDTYSPQVLTVPFVGGYLVLMVCLLGISLLRRVNSDVRIGLRGAAAAGLIVFGILAAFSIGAPIFIAGIAAAVAFALSIDRARWWSSLAVGTASALVAVGLLLVGLTELRAFGVKGALANTAIRAFGAKESELAPAL